MTVLLEVKNLHAQFQTREGILHAVNGISYDLHEGETLGIVGESGCGKSVSVLALMRLISEPPGKIAGGQALFQGRDLLTMPAEDIQLIRGGQIGMVFQDPMTSLNPVLTIGRQLTESIELHLNMSRKQARVRAEEILGMVGIPKPSERLTDYPHQFSGGMRQRVMIAIALSCSPRLLIADEPTTALDVTIQAQIIDLIKRLRDEMSMSIVWITHDLGVVAGLVERVLVMYAGLIVEEASVDDLFADPRHPYTIGLLGSLPRLDETQHRRLFSIEGTPPNLIGLPKGCPFFARCVRTVERCRRETPALTAVNPGHKVSCWVVEGQEN